METTLSKSCQRANLNEIKSALLVVGPQIISDPIRIQPCIREDPTTHSKDSLGGRLELELCTRQLLDDDEPSLSYYASSLRPHFGHLYHQCLLPWFLPIMLIHETMHMQEEGIRLTVTVALLTTELQLHEPLELISCLEARSLDFRRWTEVSLFLEKHVDFAIVRSVNGATLILFVSENCRTSSTQNGCRLTSKTEPSFYKSFLAMKFTVLASLLFLALAAVAQDPGSADTSGVDDPSGADTSDTGGGLTSTDSTDSGTDSGADSGDATGTDAGDDAGDSTGDDSGDDATDGDGTDTDGTADADGSDADGTDADGTDGSDDGDAGSDDPAAGTDILPTDDITSIPSGFFTSSSASSTPPASLIMASSVSVSITPAPASTARPAAAATTSSTVAKASNTVSRHGNYARATAISRTDQAVVGMFAGAVVAILV
ncbi:LOW QUALITY PROTEIN: hypothetical protein CVT26_012455 [Gymnopilus dilepis]|uniref:Uncharacterized protein n=1 Tax=Gymnopilus dilepis TaxID=231916 RepID=A0A409YCT7_9AGAR|nr:LOW QUALITY PROTEIN: hypothetical protein CVT26_012455 [Gymnopilus dilepis]